MVIGGLNEPSHCSRHCEYSRERLLSGPPPAATQPEALESMADTIRSLSRARMGCQRELDRALMVIAADASFASHLIALGEIRQLVRNALRELNVSYADLWTVREIGMQSVIVGDGCASEAGAAEEVRRQWRNNRKACFVAPPAYAQGAGRLNCPCWATGEFVQAPCPEHDGMEDYPKGAWESHMSQCATHGIHYRGLGR